ncbi:lmo0937 family membrane protein [Desulfonatronum thioautotrophicum]|uniref:lmo0937 family membrane protein n=1 Tax=Desulfonatronum thioautotrophicum TaxID=617001 RepID=UPI00129470B4|nr:lmo0937 family membrane protein [Desulfonatronum thioautotrophicum]
MLWTIFAICMMMWLLGLLSGTTLGGLVHVLLVIAVVVAVVQFLDQAAGKTISPPRSRW